MGTKRKPAKKRLSFSKIKLKKKTSALKPNPAQMIASKSCDTSNIQLPSNKLPIKDSDPVSKSMDGIREDTISQSQTCTLDPTEEYSVSSKDDEELKQSPSDSNDSTEKNQNTLVQISKIPTPQPRPKDVEAEETMKRHLEALKPFEPSSHKAITPKINQQKLAQNTNSNLQSPSRMISKNLRSKTPEPIKQTNANSNKNSSLNHSKSDEQLSNDMKLSRAQLQSSMSPKVIVYGHPTKNKKLEYLRGKSMRWKHPFGEAWDKRSNRYRNQSPFKMHNNWSMQSVIFKSGEDMRQEQMAMQFIKLFDKIWTDAKLPLQLRPYSVVVTSPASGFVETVPNSVSISRLKHAVTNFVSLRKFFEQFYGPIGSPGFQQAQKNFVESMAGYSLVAYFLQIKDRHNGNILLTSEGRVVHIDFDFLFSNSPGGNIGFESAPFKLTEEFIEVMGGEENSEMFDYFKILLIRGFLEARKHVRKFVLMAQIMLEGSPMPCFLAGPAVVGQLEERFATKLKNEKCVEYVYHLIEESACNWRTVQYDKFQRITNDIL